MTALTARFLGSETKKSGARNNVRDVKELYNERAAIHNINK